MSTNDRTTIGLTPENKGTMESVMDQFDEQADAAKFAMSLAIENGVEPGETANTQTVWNIGSFDPNGELRDLVVALYPTVGAPYETVEHLINQGFLLLNDHLEENKKMDIESLL